MNAILFKESRINIKMKLYWHTADLNTKSHAKRLFDPSIFIAITIKGSCEPTRE